MKTDCGRIRPRFNVGLLIFPIVFRPFPRPKLSLELQQNRTTLLVLCETEFELQKKMRDFLKNFQIVLQNSCFRILAIQCSWEIAFEKCLWERISKKNSF